MLHTPNVMPLLLRVSALELKVPPPVVALVVALLMWGCSFVVAPVQVPAVYRVSAALGLFVAGFAIRVAAQLSFVRAGTTINPMSPSRSSSFVSSGVYRFTRNPMYLGRLLQLSGWAVFLSNPLAAAFLPLFVLYITRFQILPEERAMSEQFGPEYVAYKEAVSRWL